MADFVYDKSKKTLKGQGQSWGVRSGIPGKYGSIPNGLYVAPIGALMAAEPGHGVPHHDKYMQSPYSFRDQVGFSWFLWLGTGDYGIHPDGWVRGTRGCIGIKDADTKPLFNTLRLLNKRAITVQVK